MCLAIRGFLDWETRLLFVKGRVAERTAWAAVKKIARRKLDLLHYAADLKDLRVPPGNRLEKLKHNWDGFFSIRINDQWRIVFRWTEQGPTDVGIVDYH